jgi:hypothetical protein
MTGKSITGTATVERYIPTGINHSKTWQLLGIPVKGTTSLKSSWMENNASLGNTKPGYGTTFSSEVSGATLRGWDFYTPISGSSGGPSIKSYVPATDSWIGIDNGVALTSAIQLPSSGTLNPAKAYFVFVRGDRSAQTVGAAATPTVLRCSGTLYTVGANTPPNTSVGAGKFALVANPYASAIDFTKIGLTAGVDSTFYIWDPKLPGTNNLGGYQTISSVTGYLPTPGSTLYPANVPVKTIQSGQAFFVHGSTGGTVSFTEAAKVTGSALVTRATRPDRQYLALNLYKVSSIDLGPIDGNVLAIDKNSFSNAYDRYDALKISNSHENVGITRNGKLLAIETRRSITKNDTIFYTIGNLRYETYQFRFGPDNIGGNNLEAFLVDRFLNTTTPVSLMDSTIIDFTITSDPASYQANRFYLIFKKLPPPQFAKGSEKAPVEQEDIKSSISVYPNPVVDGKMNVNFRNMPAGNYKLELTNLAGQVMLTKLISVKSKITNESIAIGRDISAGIYNLSVSMDTDKKMVQQVVIQ